MSKHASTVTSGQNLQVVSEFPEEKDHSHESEGETGTDLRSGTHQNIYLSPSVEDQQTIQSLSKKIKGWQGSKESTEESVNIVNKKNITDQHSIFSKPNLHTKSRTSQVFSNPSLDTGNMRNIVTRMHSVCHLIPL